MWIDLYMFLVIWSCYNTPVISGTSRVIGSSQPVMARVGDDVILPCHIEPPVDMKKDTVEWTRPDLKPEYVHMLQNGHVNDVELNPLYTDRTSLFTEEELSHGNVSLKLTSVKLSDEGKYKCLVPGPDRSSDIQLLVGAVSQLTISVLDIKGKFLSWRCDSGCWFPEPEMSWLDSDGNNITAEPSVTEKPSDHCYAVWRNVTVKPGGYVTCRVHLPHINHTVEKHSAKSEDGIPTEDQSTSQLGYIAFIFLLVAAILGYVCWKWREEISSPFRKCFKPTLQQSTPNSSNTGSGVNDELVEVRSSQNQLEASSAPPPPQGAVDSPAEEKDEVDDSQENVPLIPSSTLAVLSSAPTPPPPPQDSVDSPAERKARFVIEHMRELIDNVVEVTDIVRSLKIPFKFSHIEEKKDPKKTMWKLYTEVLIPEQMKDIRADFYDALKDHKTESQLLMKLERSGHRTSHERLRPSRQNSINTEPGDKERDNQETPLIPSSTNTVVSSARRPPEDTGGDSPSEGKEQTPKAADSTSEDKARFVIDHMSELIDNVGEVTDIVRSLKIPSEFSECIEGEEDPKNKMWKLYTEVLIPDQRKDIKADFYDALHKTESQLLLNLEPAQAADDKTLSEQHEKARFVIKRMDTFIKRVSRNKVMAIVAMVIPQLHDTFDDKMTSEEKMKALYLKTMMPDTREEQNIRAKLYDAYAAHEGKLLEMLEHPPKPKGAVSRSPSERSVTDTSLQPKPSCEENDEGFQDMLHPGVVCDGCEGDVKGQRFMCTDCPMTDYVYNLCSDCRSARHHSEHSMASIWKPLSSTVQDSGELDPVTGEREDQETENLLQEGRGQSTIKKKVKDDQYELNSKPTGLCVIICNVKFDEEKSRRYGQHRLTDADNLASKFSKLGFRVLMCKDLTGQNIVEALEYFSTLKNSADKGFAERDLSEKNPIEENPSEPQTFGVKEWSRDGFIDLDVKDPPQHGDAFVCCIMSHGEEGVVYGTDGKNRRIHDITATFNKEFCPALTDKPKVFFIEASQITVPPDSSDKSSQVQYIPVEADFVVASYKDKDGSRFMHSVCRQLKDGCEREDDLRTILRQVYNEMSTSSPGAKQPIMSEATKVTLKKRLVFSSISN